MSGNTRKLPAPNPVKSLTSIERSPSPLWQKALERYRQELEETEDYERILQVQSLNQLIEDFKNPQNMLSQNNALTLSTINRLGPKLKFVDDFSAVMAFCFGANATLTALVWGSIRVILTLASSAGETLQDVLDMLEELSLTLPRFRAYEDTIPMNRAFESALVDVYSQVICFYARSIHFFRVHPQILFLQQVWQEFRNDYGRTQLRIKRLSSIVEIEADRARMKVDEEKYKEVLEIIDNLSVDKSAIDKVTHFYHLPFAMNSKFWGRDDDLAAINMVLNPEDKKVSMKSLALFGMGGVGKTQLAMRYVHQSLKVYDVILWVAADNAIVMSQSFRDIADGLKVLDTDENAKDATAAMLKVKYWLGNTSCSWLLVFDNADDLNTLRLAWPVSPSGAILVTTRDLNVASSPAAESLEVKPFDPESGKTVLLRLIGSDETISSNQEHAKAISQALGGLPLALSQIGSFISHRRLSLQDFLPLYERNAARIDAKKSSTTDYNHTLETVWDVSFNKLSQDSGKLLILLCFFDPDAIHETILLEGSKTGMDEGFQFLRDEMDLGDAEESLLGASLISKMDSEPVLSIHRLVQSVTMRRTLGDQRTVYFDVAVKLLAWGFPDTWSQDVGHQIGAWEKCEKCLPHIDHLARLSKQYNITPKNVQAYGELLLRTSWYLYEREMYDVCRNLVNAALETFQDKSTLAYASALDLSGLIDLDLNQPEKALEPFNTALDIRQSRLGPEDPFIAFSLNNIALSYTEMGELEKAYAVHEEAIDLRLRNNSDRIGNSYSNMSSLLLKMGRPDEAEEMLARCPSLKDFTDDTFLNTGNPRFSGDMVLLSRIRFSQGRIDDALRLASKALAFREKLLGNRLKTCDSLYDVAFLLNKKGNKASAIQLLKQLVAIAELLHEGEGQLARAKYKLAVLYEEKGLVDDSRACKELALDLRARLRPQEKDAPFEEIEFRKLCLWMLW